MKRLQVLFVLSFTVFFTYTVLAQEFGSLRKGHEITIPQKIQKLVLDPLPAGTYSVGTGGYFPTIDSAFNKLSIDGIAGEVILELIDDLYTAPTDSFGFFLNGPIPGSGPNSRVTIKPAVDKNVTIEGSGAAVLLFMNTSYVTLDGVDLSGTTSLTIHSFYNNQFGWNTCSDFWNNSDHNVVQNITYISDDYTRVGGGPGFWTRTGQTETCDSNLIQNNFIKIAGYGIYLSAYNSSGRAEGNVIRNNIIGSETDSLIAWGIQVEHCHNTIIENNVVQNLRAISPNYGESVNLGINSFSGSGDIIRNNIVHNIKASSGYTGTGILLSGGSGSNNMVYNNMVYDIQSSSTQSNSRVAGIQIWLQNNPKIYYNTVYLTGSGANPAGSAAFYVYGGFGNSSNVDVKNNIFVNTRDETPYVASTIYDYSASNLTSDYNDLYSNNYLVRIGSTNYNTLTDWQATGKDLHSISEMPNFIVPYLHINPSVLTQINGGAFPIAEITTDIDGDLRNATTPDIGADEFFVFLDTLYVPTEYSTIQAAINAAVDGNLVLVDEGTYIENINFKGKAITVASQYLIDGDETHIENTVIDGSQPVDPDSASVVTFRSGEDTTSVICGFTITGGSGTNYFSEAIVKRLGGGIFVYYSNATIKNNIIELNNNPHNNDAYGGGIGAYSENANNYIIENNKIRNNTISTSVVTNYALGGGIYTGTIGYVRIVNNKIFDNTVTAPTAYGGGIIPANFGGGSYFILNNVISGNNINASVGGSGGIDVFNHSPVIKNNLIINNSAPLGGGAIIENASPIFSNNTIAYNTATISGGGLEIVSPVPEIMNCILWGNTAPTGSQVNGTANVSYSDVEDGYPGTENIELNPEFIDTTNFLLSNISPCIDKGNPDPMYNDIEDPNNLGFALWPALGGLRNDMGHCGGPNSFWPYLITSVEEDEADYSQPTNFSLFQNYPNPFNPTTKIKYSVPQYSQVVVKVFDILGREIETLVNEEKSIGTYELTWNAANLPSGVYFYQLRASDFTQVKKMILLR